MKFLLSEHSSRKARLASEKGTQGKLKEKKKKKSIYSLGLVVGFSDCRFHWLPLRHFTVSSFLMEPCCGTGIMPFSTKPYVSHHKHGDPIALPVIGFEWACVPTFG